MSMADDNPFATTQGTEAPVAPQQQMLEQTRTAVWAAAVLLSVPGALLLLVGAMALLDPAAWVGWLGFAATLLGFMVFTVVAQVVRFASSISEVVRDPAPFHWRRMLRAERDAWLAAAMLSLFTVIGVLARVLSGPL